jgi:hypothetical protein
MDNRRGFGGIYLNYPNYGILNNQFQLVMILGNGLTSVVYLGISLENEALQVAVKLFKAEFFENAGNMAKKLFIDELYALKSLTHPNIV